MNITDVVKMMNITIWGKHMNWEYSDTFEII